MVVTNMQTAVLVIEQAEEEENGRVRVAFLSPDLLGRRGSAHRPVDEEGREVGGRRLPRLTGEDRASQLEELMADYEAMAAEGKHPVVGWTLVGSGGRRGASSSSLSHLVAAHAADGAVPFGAEVRGVLVTNSSPSFLGGGLLGGTRSLGGTLRGLATAGVRWWRDRPMACMRRLV